MTRTWNPALVHQVREWAARVAWCSGAVALFVPVRVSMLGFSGQEGPGSCGSVPWRSIVTLWETQQLCDHKALGWLAVGRVAIVVAIIAAALWRVAYVHDSMPD